MAYVTITSIHPAISVITLDRAEKHNALNLTLMEELVDAIEALQQQPGMRAVIFAAKGTTFCSGLDLLEVANTALVEVMAQHVARLLTTIYKSSLVTIAAVSGNAIAGGAGIVAACDYALLAEGALMGFPETRRGLVAAQVATLLCRQMRMRDVRELLLLGELVDSSRAQAMGLINKVVPLQQLMPEAIKVTEMILLGAPESVRQTKLLLDRLNPANFFDDLEVALSFHHAARHSDEAKEGVAAFLEHRSPHW